MVESLRANTIALPSGDQSGAWSVKPAGGIVTRTAPVPSAPIV